MKRAPSTKASPGRHEKQCSICKHAEREAIEAGFVGWQSPAKLGKAFGISKDAIFRHARAFHLLEPRRRNVRAALEKIIEQAGDVAVNAGAVVAAVATYAKLNGQGRWIDRTESVDLNELFARMTQQEMQRYVDTGATPEWFPVAPGREREGGSNEF